MPRSLDPNPQLQPGLISMPKLGDAGAGMQHCSFSLSGKALGNFGKLA